MFAVNSCSAALYTRDQLKASDSNVPTQDSESIWPGYQQYINLRRQQASSKQALRDDLLCMVGTRGDVRTGAFLAGTRPGGRLQARLTPPRVRSRREGAQVEPSVRSSHRVSCVRSVHQVRRIFRLSNSRDLGDPDPLGQRLIACAETELCSKQAV